MSVRKSETAQMSQAVAQMHILDSQQMKRSKAHRHDISLRDSTVETCSANNLDLTMASPKGQTTSQTLVTAFRTSTCICCLPCEAQSHMDFECTQTVHQRERFGASRL